MAVLSDYTDGTITVTNGSVDFTGTDTLWRSAAFREGDTVLLQGFTSVIAGTSENDPLILSNTTGQFTEPWPGASGTFSYRMRYQPDNARFSAKSTALINLLANGILRGIADIGVEEGKLLIGGVAGLYDLIDKSDLGLQDPNGSLGKLAALTLGARQILQTDATGALKQVELAANKFLRTDANGDIALSDIAAWAISMLGLVGAANKFPYLNAANTAALADITDLGRAFLALTGTNGNIPVMTGAGTAASRPIVGTVSQSGGIPTGAIVEASASTAAGYMRLAGGVQICWRVTGNIPSSSTNLGYIVGGTSYELGQFPAAFISQPATIVGGTGSGGGGWIAQDIFGSASAWGNYSARHHVAIGSQVQFFGIAIGRWY